VQIPFGSLWLFFRHPGNDALRCCLARSRGAPRKDLIAFKPSQNFTRTSRFSLIQRVRARMHSGRRAPGEGISRTSGMAPESQFDY
jgi:hypothetical protein